MKKARLYLLGILLFIGLSSHDLFLIMDSYLLEPGEEYVLSLYNGTFKKSENPVTSDRMIDMSIAGPGESIAKQDVSKWKEESTKMVFPLETKNEGTFVVGVSTRARMINLSKEDFNDYLEHDGILDILEERRKTNGGPDTVRESYAKHVKAIVQVGENTSKSHQVHLGYPIEFISVNNPYESKIGDNLEVQLLRNGKPVDNYLVYAGFQYKGIYHTDKFSGRTNKDGKFVFPLESPGIWYVRTIMMEKVDEDKIDYESNWTTLTFEVAEP